MNNTLIQLASLFLAAIFSSLLGCAGDGSFADEESVCQPQPEGGMIGAFGGEPCDRLSSYGLFASPLSALAPNDGVAPYDLVTPLFTDGAIKRRHLYLPTGKRILYREEGPLDFPVGSILVKSFGFPSDPANPNSPTRWIETRLLVHSDEGWVGLPYIWNDEGTDAIFDPFGKTVDVETIDNAGLRRNLNYRIPDANKCRGCHEMKAGSMGPIGPQAVHLNRSLDYTDGPENQLSRWARLGWLNGAPDAEEIPRGGALDDPDSGSLDLRARTYLDINCAHCHNPEGGGRTSGLDLRITQQEAKRFGVCKSPLSAARGIGTLGISFDIEPGRPADSLLFFRLASEDPGIMMPELGRSIVDQEGLALIEEWIASLEGECTP